MKYSLRLNAFKVYGCPLVEVDDYFKVEPVDDEVVKILETHGLPYNYTMQILDCV